MQGLGPIGQAHGLITSRRWQLVRGWVPRIGPGPMDHPRSQLDPNHEPDPVQVSLGPLPTTDWVRPVPMDQQFNLVWPLTVDQNGLTQIFFFFFATQVLNEIV